VTTTHPPRRPSPRSLLATALLALLALALLAPAASAHPLGNFTTNTSSALLPGPDAIEVVYVLDLAEIPTQQSRGAIAQAGSPEAWAQEECRTIAGAQRLSVGGQAVGLQAEGAAISFPPGEAGLDTLRLTCALMGETGPLDGATDIAYGDDYVMGRTGWREVIAAGDGTTLLSSDVPETSSTQQLRQYPEAEILRITEASVTVDPSGGDPAPAELRDADLQPVVSDEGLVTRVLESFTGLVARQDLTAGFVLFAIVVSILLGTAHAVAPGHGKTVIAAYLLGEGGQAKQAVALGGTVAVTHTIGVLVLGVIVQTSTTLAPESLYPILGVMGGVLFALLGMLLLYRAITRKGHSHDHDHGHSHGGHDHAAHDHGAHDDVAHDHAGVTVGATAATAVDVVETTHGPGHDHHDHGSDHDHGSHDHADHDHADHGHDHGAGHDHHGHGEPAPLGWRMLILPGLAGGMVPSPSALVVLLGGIALERTWFGILLVVCYGIGMAMALVGAGYLLHRMRYRLIDKLEGPTWARISGVLPIATSSLIIVGGFVIVARSLLTA
jgi:nickel/cobalt transporter (NicO) family protein